MQFEYYVLNYDINRKCVVNYNIFNNIRVNETVEKEIKKYLRAPNKYAIPKKDSDESYMGFEALCTLIESTIMWKQWSRREYEISVGDAFCTEVEELEKWDVYSQCKPNIPMIARECIWQYKHKKED